jgi:hypothetical protein
MTIKKIIKEGEEVPSGYGAAIYDYFRFQTVCYPVPLNLIVRFLDGVWYRIKQPYIRDREAELMAAYSKGRQDGRNEAFKEMIGGINKGGQA